MYNNEITDKRTLLEVIEALDKLKKKYVITKTFKVEEHNYKHTYNVWHVQEVTDESKEVPLQIDGKVFAKLLNTKLRESNDKRSNDE